MRSGDSAVRTGDVLEIASHYRAIARHSPNVPEVGGAFIGITETVAGHEREFNRWYEDDHFYSGAMAGPWVLSGRRWVATHAHRKTWIPECSPILSPHGQGCYLKTYWFAAGHENDAQFWMNEAFTTLLEPDRFPTMPFGDQTAARVDRVSAYSSFQQHLFTCTRDSGPLQAIHALDYPFGGVALDIVHVGGTPKSYVPQIQSAIHDTLTTADCRIAMSFERAPSKWLPSADDPNGGEFTVLWFFDAPPPPQGYAPSLRYFHATLEQAGGRLAVLTTDVRYGVAR